MSIFDWPFYTGFTVCENDEDSPTHAVNSGHLGYRKFVSEDLAKIFFDKLLLCGLIVLFMHVHKQ